MNIRAIFYLLFTLLRCGTLAITLRALPYKHISPGLSTPKENEEYIPTPSENFQSHAADVMRYKKEGDGTLNWKGFVNDVPRPTHDDIRLHRNEADAKMRADAAKDPRISNEKIPATVEAKWYPHDPEKEESEMTDLGSLVFTSSIKDQIKKGNSPYTPVNRQVQNFLKMCKKQHRLGGRCAETLNRAYAGGNADIKTLGDPKGALLSVKGYHEKTDSLIKTPCQRKNSTILGCRDFLRGSTVVTGGEYPGGAGRPDPKAGSSRHNKGPQSAQKASGSGERLIQNSGGAPAPKQPKPQQPKPQQPKPQQPKPVMSYADAVSGKGSSSNCGGSGIGKRSGASCQIRPPSKDVAKGQMNKSQAKLKAPLTAKNKGSKGRNKSSAKGATHKTKAATNRTKKPPAKGNKKAVANPGKKLRGKTNRKGLSKGVKQNKKTLGRQKQSAKGKKGNRKVPVKNRVGKKKFRVSPKTAVKGADKSRARKTPAKIAAVKKAPAKKTLANQVSAKKTPVKKTPVKKTPVKKTPAKKTPAKKTPAKKTPPVKKTPAKKPPTKKAPTKNAGPASKKSLAQKAMTKKALSKKAPAQKAAVKKAPNKASAKKAPAQKAPAKKIPAKKAPAKKIPAKKTPVKKTPVKKTPPKKVSTSPKVAAAKAVTKSKSH